MTIKDIRTIMAVASATPNKIYSAVDEAAQVRYWIGLGNGRLREITANEAQSIQDKNRTVVTATPTTTSSTPTATTATGGDCEIDYTATMSVPGFSAVTSTGQVANSATIAQRNKVIGIAKAAVGAGFVGQAQGCGEITNPLWAWTVGDKIFLNGTSLSTTAPSTGFSQMIGTATAADTIDVSLQPTILL